MTPVHLLKNFSDLYIYSFWKICHPVLCPVRLLQTVHLLETLEYIYVQDFFDGWPGLKNDF